MGILSYLHRRTKAKHTKLSDRLVRNIQTGRFEEFSTRKRDGILRKLEKERIKFTRLTAQLALTAGVGAATLALTSGQVLAQSPQTEGLGPFVEASRENNPLRPPITHPQGYTNGYALADIDADGDEDLYYSITGDSDIFFVHENLYNERGYTIFKDPVPVAINPSSFLGSGDVFLSFIDADGDTDLDLYVGRYSPYACSPPHNSFFINTNNTALGDLKLENFTDVSGTALDKFNPIIGLARDVSITAVNIDDDSDLDFFVGSQTTNDIRFIRNTTPPISGSFDEIGHSSLDVDGISKAKLAFIDIDIDGDQDVFIGGADGKVRFFRNNDIENGGGLDNYDDFILNDSNPRNPFSTLSFGQEARPYIVDIDGDGELDIVVGFYDYTYFPDHPYSPYYKGSNWRTFINDGNNYFTEVYSLENPFGGVDVFRNATPNLVNIDLDADLEAFIGGRHDKIRFFENTSNTFQQQTGTSNPLNDFNYGYNGYLKPELADTDNDGDLDAYVGVKGSSPWLNFFYNDGTGFVFPSDNTNSLVQKVDAVKYSSTDNPFPVIGDMDGDGDLDALLGGIESSACSPQYHQFFLNQISPPSPPPADTPADFADAVRFTNVYFNKWDVPELADLDHDGDLDIQRVRGGGDIRTFRNDGSLNFTLLSSSDNHLFDINSQFTYSNPAIDIVDFDQDGDLDVFLGDYYGQIHFFENTNEPPDVSFASGTLTALENIPIFIDGALSTSDPDLNDNTHLSEAIVTITGFVGGEDQLTFTPTGGITGVFDGPGNPGALILSGRETVANYHAVLQSVRYTNTSDSPTLTPRDLLVEVRDTDWTNPVSIPSRPLVITPVNDAPGGVISGPPSTFTEDVSGPVPIETDFSITDPDDVNLEGAILSFSGSYTEGEDFLLFTDQLGITGSFDGPTGNLTLSGSSSLSNYETALESIMFNNTSDDPNTSSRQIFFEIDDGEDQLYLGPKDVTVAATNDLPVLSGGTLTIPYNPGDGQVSIGSFAISDPDDTDASGGVIDISSGYVNGDDLLTESGSVTSTFDTGLGELQLTGTDPFPDYITTLNTVTYENQNPAPDFNDRTLDIEIRDGTGGLSSAITLTVELPPTLTIASTDLQFTEDVTGPVSIDPSLVINDDQTTIEAAEITIGNYQSGEDFLNFTPQAGITSTFSSGVLSLTGTTTLANYQIALRSVTYQNSSNDPNPADRTLTINVSPQDGILSSLDYSRTLKVAATNDPPSITSTAPVTADEEVQYTYTATASDLDDLASVLVWSISNAPSGMAVSSSGVVTWIPGPGVTTSGAVTLTVQDDELASGVETFTITVTPANVPPVLAATSTDLVYAAESGPVPIDPAITVNDADTGDNIESATISISTGFVSAEDELAFTSTGSITGSYDSSTGILSLSGSGTPAEYEAVLQSVTYENLISNPSTTNRVVSYTVNDGSDPSNTVSRAISITVNMAPSVAIASTDLTYTENDNPINIDGGLIVSDDTPQLVGATVTISSNYINGEDLLVLNTNGAISATFGASLGELTLTGTATVSEYQDALRAVQYQNTSENPGTATRTVSIVVNDGTNPSTPATRDIQITPVNDAPLMQLGSTSFSFTEGDPDLPIITGLLLLDVDNTNLQGATIAFTSNYNSNSDLLTFVYVPPATNAEATPGAANLTVPGPSTLTGGFDTTTGILTLTGDGTLADYVTVLESISYSNSSDDPGSLPRTLTLNVTDGSDSSPDVVIDLTVQAVNDAPTLSGSSTDLAHKSLTGAIVIDDQISISDPDDLDITGANVSVLTNYSPGEDVLVFVDQGGITGSFNSISGVLALSGTASLAVYEQALSSITYENTVPTPSATSKQISFVIQDATDISNTHTRTVSISANVVNAADINEDVAIGESTTFDVIDEGTFDPADVITTTILTGPAQGEAAVNPDGSITYTPDIDAFGDDEIEYELCNQYNSCGTGTITIDIGNDPPVIQEIAQTTDPGEPVSFSLADQISDANGNFDPASVAVVIPTISGAEVEIDAELNVLIDYSKTSGFTGADRFTIEVCDLSGECSEQEIVIYVGELEEVNVFNAVSPNGDGRHDFLHLQDLEFFVENDVYIYDKLGREVFYMKNYSNDDLSRAFMGQGNDGEDLPDGTYYYALFLKSASGVEQKQSGFFIISR